MLSWYICTYCNDHPQASASASSLGIFKFWYSHLKSRVSRVIYCVSTGMIYRKQAFGLTLNHLKFGFQMDNCVPQKFEVNDM